jgi:hypothetical protein
MTCLAHCLDHVRQIIECSGDLSPVPLYLRKDIIVQGKPLYIATGAKHTCRRFDKSDIG